MFDSRRVGNWTSHWPPSGPPCMTSRECRGRFARDGRSRAQWPPGRASANGGKGRAGHHAPSISAAISRPRCWPAPAICASCSSSPMAATPSWKASPPPSRAACARTRNERLTLDAAMLSRTRSRRADRRGSTASIRARRDCAVIVAHRRSGRASSAVDAATPPRHRHRDAGVRSAQLAPPAFHRHRQRTRRAAPPPRCSAASAPGRQGRPHRRLARPPRPPRAPRGLCRRPRRANSRHLEHCRPARRLRRRRRDRGRALDAARRTPGPRRHLQSGRRQCRARGGAAARPAAPASSASSPTNCPTPPARACAPAAHRRGARPEPGWRNPRRHRRRPPGGAVARCRVQSEPIEIGIFLRDNLR